MSNCDKIQRSAIDIWIAPMGAACVEPPPPGGTAITTTAAETRTATAGAIDVSALPVGFDLAAGKYLNFTNPTTGEEILVKTTARVLAAATSIPVTNIPADLPSGAILQWPPKLTGRTGANLQRQGNLITIQTFDSGGDDEGKEVSRSNTFDLPGVFSPLSAAGKMILGKAVGEYFYVWLRERAYSANYIRGQEVKGQITINSDGVNWSPSDVTRSDYTATFFGSPIFTDAVLAP